VKLRSASLVAGAAGYIGSHVRNEVLARGHAVVVPEVARAKKNGARQSKEFGALDNSKNLPPSWRESNFPYV
jgi:nucleoside-diphosphate-sugar epimerase